MVEKHVSKQSKEIKKISNLEITIMPKFNNCTKDQNHLQ